MDKLNEIALQPYLDGKHGVILQGEAIAVLARRAQDGSEPYVPVFKCHFCGGEVPEFEIYCSASCRKADNEIRN